MGGWLRLMVWPNALSKNVEIDTNNGRILSGIRNPHVHSTTKGWVLKSLALEDCASHQHLIQNGGYCRERSNFSFSR